MSAATRSAEALEVANRVRAERAALKRRLRCREATLADALVAPCMQRAEVERLMLALPRVGPSKLRRFLRSTNIAPRRLVGSLTARECAALSDAVETWWATLS